MNAPAQQKITINYPNRSGSNWPLFLAKDGGYYQKYGLDVTLTFGVMPAGIAMLASGEAQMVNSSLEQLMQAASKDGSLVLIGSSLNRGVFALMAAKDINSIKDLKGKRIAVGQVGDAPYGYLVALLVEIRIERAGCAVDSGGHGRERTRRGFDQRPRGCDAADRAGVFQGGGAGFKTLANLAEHPDIFASTAYLMKKSVVAADPKLPEKLIQAQAEAIKRFYEDKAFAVQDVFELRQDGRTRPKWSGSTTCTPSRKRLRASSVRAGGRGQIRGRSAVRSADRGADEGLRLPQGHRQ